MKNELLAKIHKTLADGITQEKDLVYLLVEIRKLMDREKYKDAVIKSFSNWVVHIELSLKGDGTTEVLQEFDLIVKIFVENGTSKRIPIHYNFDGLRARLKKFLKQFNLPTALTEDNNKWGIFVFLYASIVGDCPISFKASKMQLKYIKELELRGYPHEPDLKWKVTLKDGETSSFSVGTASFAPPLTRRQP